MAPAGAHIKEIGTVCGPCLRKRGPVKRLDPERVQRMAEEEW
jgi:hypothetical protein